MPIKIQKDLPAKAILESENIFVMDEDRAMSQDIRPLEILILNLMPIKEDTETQLLRAPLFCTSATICRATVVLPLDSGPYTSMIRPFGTPPSPSAISRLREPVGIVSIFIFAPESPSFITEPFPYAFSICVNAASNAFSLSSLFIFPSKTPLRGQSRTNVLNLVLS